MTTAHAEIREPGLLASLLSDDVFHPAEPQSLEETGISPVVIETLICKYLLQVGSTSGRDIAQQLCLPFGILEDVLLALRSRQVLVHQGQAALSDYCYALTEQGVAAARAAMQACCVRRARCRCRSTTTSCRSRRRRFGPKPRGASS